MLKVTDRELAQVELQYPGITDWVRRLEAEVLPVCPVCGSADTAVVLMGVIGRTIHIVWATTKAKLLMNGPRPGTHYCNHCQAYFTQATH